MREGYYPYSPSGTVFYTDFAPYAFEVVYRSDILLSGSFEDTLRTKSYAGFTEAAESVVYLNLIPTLDLTSRTLRAELFL